ncbi:hypothetical protein SLA2020_187450 [Shorea laevis]
MANYPHYRSQFGDTTYTKLFVGGLAWETPTGEMRRYFEQFGEILEAVIIMDKNTGKSKGYGFVTFRDPESARRACAVPNPVIGGRKANCNIASLGRPRPPPSRGRFQGSSPYQRVAPSYSGVAGTVPPPIPPPHVIFPPYGYPTYTPDYGYHPAPYNPQVQQLQYYHNQVSFAPYYYGYSFRAARGTYSATQPEHPSYLYYPAAQMEESVSPYPSPPLQVLHRNPFPSSFDSQVSLATSTGMEAGPATSDQGPII